ncbi:MAG: hypothetical protein GF315_00110 [candidate division Zixibacteria bacterium]|nr:hypothetical protein [candidate division Zixibacteria bacterium]
MNIFQKPITLFIAVMLGLSTQVIATEFVSSGAYNFREGEVLADDLIMTGESARISGSIDGDLIAACRSVVINGNINGSAYCADQYTKVLGNINGSLTTFCQDAQINGSIRRNIITIGSSLTLGPEGRVGRDVSFFGGEAVIEGRVANDVLIRGDVVIIAGTIEGDVNIEAGKITLLPSAVIKGNLDYKSDRQAKIEDGATILGVTNWEELDQTEAEPSDYNWLGAIPTFNGLILGVAIAIQLIGIIFSAVIGDSFFTLILFFILIYVTSIIAIAFFKKQIEAVLESISNKPLKIFSIGLISSIVLPVVTIISLIIMPIALMLTSLGIILNIMGFILGAVFMGHIILSRLKGGTPASLYLSSLLGIAVLSLLMGIPYLGVITIIAATLFGFGGLITLCYNYKKGMRDEVEASVD